MSLYKQGLLEVRSSSSERFGIALSVQNKNFELLKYYCACAVQF